MKTTLKQDLLKLLFWMLVTLLIVLIGKTLTHAQPKSFYLGVEAGFGSRSFTTESNIPQIDQLTTIKGGGSLGVVFGTSAIKVPVVAGLYFQSIDAARSIDLFSVQTGINVSWLHLHGINSPIDVYSIAGLDFQNFTFMGTYLEKPEDGYKRFVLGEPLLGNHTILNANIGVGVELRLIEDYDFLYLFVETKKTIPLVTGSSSFFGNTTVTSNTAINIGVRVGRIR